MNQNLKHLFLFTIMACLSATMVQPKSDDCCDTTCKTGCAQSQNLWQPHAFSVSTAREVLLQKPAWVDLQDNEGWFGTFGVAVEYNQNWGECNTCDSDCSTNSNCNCCNLGSLPFWAADQSSTMKLGNNSGNGDLDVYQLGLGPVADSITGTVTLSPKVYQTGAHFLFYLGAHKEERGFFAKIGGPVGVISVDPRLSCSDGITAADYTAGLFNSGSTDAVSAPYANIKEAFAGGKDAGSFYKGMKFGKISTCKQTSSAKFGDLAFALGYNVFADEAKHLGVAARFSAPTGNTAKAEYVLEPLYGRNDHWGAGVEVIGHWKAWDSEDKALTIWMDATVEHLFRSNHKRSFDLKGNGLGSKYLLLAKYNGTTFANEIVNAVNVTTLDVESSFAVEANFDFTFDFNWGNWSMALAYDGWARSCEKLAINCDCEDTIDLSSYAVLGRQQPYTQAAGAALNLCQPDATISKSEAYATTAGGKIKDATAVANRLNKDVNEALDICAQEAHSAFTSKVTAQLAYTFKDSDYAPYIGIMGGAEFSHSDNAAVNFWAVGAHGGLAF